jgi:hypothetical protein
LGDEKPATEKLIEDILKVPLMLKVLLPSVHVPAKATLQLNEEAVKEEAKLNTTYPVIELVGLKVIVELRALLRVCGEKIAESVGKLDGTVLATATVVRFWL